MPFAPDAGKLAADPLWCAADADVGTEVRTPKIEGRIPMAEIQTWRGLPLPASCNRCSTSQLGRLACRHASLPPSDFGLLLYQDKVILNGDHDGDSYLVALSRADGRILWKTPRDNHTRSYGEHANESGKELGVRPWERDGGGRIQMAEFKWQ
jgi:hypothetical protein